MPNTEDILNAAKEKMKTFFKGLVSVEEQEALSAWVKQAETPVSPETPSNKEVKTKDGKILSIEGELAVDAVIKEVTPDGMVELADGDYVLVDDAGTELTIKVVGGKVAEMGAAKTEEKPAEMPAEMKAALASQDKLINDQATAIKGLTDQVVLLTKSFQKMLETPVNFSDVKPAKSWDEMSAFEKWKASKEG